MGMRSGQEYNKYIGTVTVKDTEALCGTLTPCLQVGVNWVKRQGTQENKVLWPTQCLSVLFSVINLGNFQFLSHSQRGDRKYVLLYLQVSFLKTIILNFHSPQCIPGKVAQIIGFYVINSILDRKGDTVLSIRSTTPSYLFLLSSKQ